LETNNIDYLTIKIEYKNSIPLFSFKESLDGWYNQYNKHLAQSSISKKDETLLIKEIKEGSIIINMISSVIPLISDVNTITTFFKSVKHSITWLSGKEGVKPKYDIEELTNIRKMLGTVTSKDKNINVTVNGDNNDVLFVDNLTVNIIRNNVDEEIKLLSTVQVDEITPDETFRDKVILKFKQTESTEKNNKSTKGVISEIDSKSHPIFFDEGLKQKIILGIDNPHTKKYLVNVKVHKESGIISGYTILKVIDTMSDVETSEQSENTLFPDND